MGSFTIYGLDDFKFSQTNLAGGGNNISYENEQQNNFGNECIDKCSEIITQYRDRQKTSRIKYHLLRIEY